MSVKNYYRLLGIGIEAEAVEIKKAYRRLAKGYHPDARPDEDVTVAREKFNEITEAYEVLIDPDRRRKYDQMNSIGFDASIGYQPVDLSPEEDDSTDIPCDHSTGPTGQNAGDGTPKNNSGPAMEEKKGGRLVAVDVSFEVAVRGGKQMLTIPVEEKCEKCGGTGAKSKRAIIVCPGCGGEGVIHGPGVADIEEKKCPRCSGKGNLIRERCNRCQGQGRSRKDRKVALIVPPGVETGARMMLTDLVEPDDQEGCEGIGVEFKVSDHPFFRREGLDIHWEIPISAEQAREGSDVVVRTAMGRRVLLKIPSGTDSGTTFRIKNEGIVAQERRGDQFVRVRIVTPKEPSNKAGSRFGRSMNEMDSRKR